MGSMAAVRGPVRRRHPRADPGQGRQGPGLLPHPGNNLEVITQTSINSGYGPPQILATGIGDDPAAALGADGRIYVFFPGTDDALWYLRNQDLQYETYTAATSLGGAIFATPSPILDGGGRIVVALKGVGETLYTIQQQTENSSAWGPSLSTPPT
ncbi:hypothetical protein GCM10017744_007970 [Streptomyces antimycoticus]